MLRSVRGINPIGPSPWEVAQIASSQVGRNFGKERYSPEIRNRRAGSRMMYPRTSDGAATAQMPKDCCETRRQTSSGTVRDHRAFPRPCPQTLRRSSTLASRQTPVAGASGSQCPVPYPSSILSRKVPFSCLDSPELQRSTKRLFIPTPDLVP